MTSDAAIGSTLEGEYDGNGLSQLKDACQFGPQRPHSLNVRPHGTFKERKVDVGNGTGPPRGQFSSRSRSSGEFCFVSMPALARRSAVVDNIRHLPLLCRQPTRQDKKMPGKSEPGINTGVWGTHS
ncbi:hypothetical protein ACVW1C_004410 [Bradyrhizobium sp. USDA 4011]